MRSIGYTAISHNGCFAALRHLGAIDGEAELCGSLHFKIQKMTCNIVLSKNIVPKQEDIEEIRAFFNKDVHIYTEMLKQELAYSIPKFLLSSEGLVRIESDIEKEILIEIQKVKKEYSDKYGPYIFFS